MKRTGVTFLAGIAAMLAGIGAWAASATPPFPWSGLMGTDGDFYQPPSQSAYPIRLELPVAVPLPATYRVSLPDRESQSNEIAGDAPVPSSSDADIAENAAGIITQATDNAPRGSLVAVAFDISQFGQSASLDDDGKIMTSKPVFLAGTRLGAIQLAVGQGASVSVDREDLAALVGDRAPPLTDALSRLKGERVTLESLRTRDVAIRYDPLSDTLVIETKS